MQTFNELPLSPLLLEMISGMGYSKPSPIQSEALPILLGEPTDFIGLAATGTGKTAAFTLPILEKIDASKRGVQALVLCPTRELAIQVSGQISLMGRVKSIKALPVYGGSSFGDQVYGLKQGAKVVVGTPGRLVDHLERGTLKLNDVAIMVLDEADEMISMGFKEELEKILAAANRETCRIWLFSATMSPEVRRVADKYLKEPQYVQVNKKEMLSNTVEQFFYPTQERDKAEILCKLIDMAQDFYGLIFCQTKSLVVDLTHYLTDKGYKVDCLHGDKDQTARERTMNAFRARKVNILVCTDVASRGLDVKDITHVINYSLPRELDNYVHRIGRTARIGKAGIAMSLVTPSHRGLIQRIERLTKSRLVEGRIPSRRDIAAKKVAAMFEKFSAQSRFGRAVELLSPAWREAVSSMSNEEVAGRFLSLLFPEIGIESGSNRETASKPHEENVFKPVPSRAATTPSLPAYATPSPHGNAKPVPKSSIAEPKRTFRRDERRSTASATPKRTIREDEPRNERTADRRPSANAPSHRTFRYDEPGAERKPTARERFSKHEGPNRKERRKAKFGDGNPHRNKF